MWRKTFAILTAVATAALGAASAAAVGFHAHAVLPGSAGGSEPSLAISPTGIRYASWQSPGEFARSLDGINWLNTGMPDSSALGDVTNAVDAAGAVYNGQICGGPTILHTCVYRSLDRTKTWPQKTLAADSHPGASDRPWIDVYPHRRSVVWNPDATRVYLEYHTFSPEDLAYVTVSTDGGKTFSPPAFITTDTNAINGSGCNTVPSGVAVDDRNGVVYALWLSGNDVVTNVTTGCNYSQIGPFNKAWVSTSTDGGLTWTAHLAWQGAFDPITKIGDNADKIFGTLAVDTAGNVHVMLPVRHNDDPVGYVASCETGSSCQETPQATDLYLVSSPDQGAHWTQPFQVNAARGSFFFPWIAAGSSGRVDAIYYVSSTFRPNDPASLWYAGFAQILHAIPVRDAVGTHYRTSPTASRQRVVEDVEHRGGICTFGIFCSVVPHANRSLADSIAIALDPNGGANLVWTDDAVPPARVRHINFACQESGTSAFAGVTINGCYQGR